MYPSTEYLRYLLQITSIAPQLRTLNASPLWERVALSGNETTRAGREKPFVPMASP